MTSVNTFLVVEAGDNVSRLIATACLNARGLGRYEIARALGIPVLEVDTLNTVYNTAYARMSGARRQEAERWVSPAFADEDGKTRAEKQPDEFISEFGEIFTPQSSPRVLLSSRGEAGQGQGRYVHPEGLPSGCDEGKMNKPVSAGELGTPRRHGFPHYFKRDNMSPRRGKETGRSRGKTSVPEMIALNWTHVRQIPDDHTRLWLASRYRLARQHRYELGISSPNFARSLPRWAHAHVVAMVDEGICDLEQRFNNTVPIIGSSYVGFELVSLTLDQINDVVPGDVRAWLYDRFYFSRMVRRSEHQPNERSFFASLDKYAREGQFEAKKHHLASPATMVYELSPFNDGHSMLDDPVIKDRSGTYINSSTQPHKASPTNIGSHVHVASPDTTPIRKTHVSIPASNRPKLSLIKNQGDE